MGVGRFICVALPLALTIASLIALLIATLSGVVDKSLFIFSVDLSHLNLNAQNLGDIASDLGANGASGIDLKPRVEVNPSLLHLGESYEITLWGFCSTDSKGDVTCTKPEFDWATKRLNDSYLDNIGAVADVQINIPDDIKDALNAFKTGIKWIEIVFIIACVALGVEILLGVFAICSRAISCITWLEALLTAVLTCAAAIVTTALSVVVVGSLDSVGKEFDISASIGTKYLATVWIAAAFSIASAVTWIFTICCCKPDHYNRKGYKHRSGDGEKLMPSRYVSIEPDHEMTGGNYYNQESQYGYFDPNGAQYSQPSHYPSNGPARSTAAYEPYSHRA